MTTTTTTAPVTTTLTSVAKSYERKRFLERTETQPENPFSRRIQGQKIVHIPSFTLESGVELQNVPVAYMSWGALNPRKNNALVVCHALSGSADVGDWWAPLLGPGKAFDTDTFFVICMNSLGSPYGTASPVTAKNGNLVEGLYGADFPMTTIRDDVRLHRLVLDHLGIRQVAAVIGGSMGGMLTLEWAYWGQEYVRCIVAIATASHQSAWAIGWSESQRQAIFGDHKYQNGNYQLHDPPVTGLKAARMAALLTYRTRESFERRFGRDLAGPRKTALPQRGQTERKPSVPNAAIENKPKTSIAITPSIPHFSVQSYLQYQAEKFCRRFDSNCYVALTHKLDSHDISRGRADSLDEALTLIQQPTLVLGIRSDALYTLPEQELIARNIPNADFREILSQDGHDGFLIESTQLNRLIIDFLFAHLIDLM